MMQTQGPGSGTDVPVYVGVDWAGEHHDVFVTNERSEKLGAFRIAHSIEGLDLLTRRLREFGAAPAAVQIALERPDGLLVAALLEQGYAVYPINPKAVDRYRDRHHTSGAKDDARDAQALAHILRTDGERFRPLRPEGDLAAELRLTIRAYRELVAEGVRLTNQLHACLADYYPAAPGLFSELDAAISLAFLVRFPTPQDARSAGRDGIVAWLEEQGYAHPERAEQVAERAAAKALTAGAGVVRARSRQMVGLVAALQAVIAAKQTHVKALEELLGQHPDGGLFLGLPGAGVVTAAALSGELGEDRDALPSAQALQSVGGTAPVTIQSGKSRRVIRRRACNRQLNEALIQFARCSLMRAGCGDEGVAWVRDAYLARRQAGDTARQAYRVLANRWATILWAMWTRREAYDHERYAKARATRALPKAS
jgi:transposase